MARKLKSDRILFTAAVLLVCVSVVMVYSASAALALDRYGQAYMFLTRQAMWTVLGLVALAVSMRIDYRTYRNEAFIWSLTGVVCAMLVLVLFSAPINGARRWFNSVVWASSRQDRQIAATSSRRSRSASCTVHRRGLPLVAAVCDRHRCHGWPDSFLSRSGTAISLLMAVATIIFAAGLNYRYLVGTVLAAAPVLYFLIASSPYRLRRLLAFMNPEADPLGDGFQVMQSLIAVGTGGVFGRGLMGGVQKLFFLPEPHTDFIYAVIGRAESHRRHDVLICFCVIAWRGVRVAMRAQDAFGSYLALGLTAMIAVQALVNISVVLGLLPTKGIPLPLVSSGGSSLMISLLAMGILLNVSQHEE
jgi:cell division protein FtsW